MQKEYTRSELSELRIRRNRIRRERQLRRRIVIALASFIIILMSTIGVTSFISKAQETAPEEDKCYTSVMVPYGSCMTQLASEYIDMQYYDTIEDYISEVMYINHLDNTDIRAGSYLIMPYYQAM